MIFDMFDHLVAEVLQVSVGEFVSKIEATTEFRRATIIMTCLQSEDPNKLDQARRVFKMLNNE